MRLKIGEQKICISNSILKLGPTTVLSLALPSPLWPRSRRPLPLRARSLGCSSPDRSRSRRRVLTSHRRVLSRPQPPPHLRSSSAAAARLLGHHRCWLRRLVLIWPPTRTRPTAAAVARSPGSCCCFDFLAPLLPPLIWVMIQRALFLRRDPFES